MGWIRISAAVGVYFVCALLAAALIKRRGGDLREMEGRGAPAVLVIGTLGNLVVLGAVLLFVVLVDKQPLAALGLGFEPRDAFFTTVTVALTISSGAAFLALLHRLRLLDVEPKSLPAGSGGRLLSLVAVLFVVALQEEVLFRGYITLNLMSFGPAVVLVVSTLVFTAIHFPTNRVSPAQVAGWLFGGFILGWAYLGSGSIWVPVSLHFAIDMTNVLVFGVAGDLAVAALSRPLSDMDRALYRAGYAVLIGVVLVGVYGLHLAPGWAG